MTKTKKITLAKYAGFCYGVKRAVDTVKKIKLENPDKNVCVLGELIHNSNVIKELESFGIISLDKLPENGEGICVIRSHGESPQTIDKINKAGFEVYDLTCPDVKKVQQKAVELVKDGYYLVIVGKEEHPEVAAIKANAKQYCENVIVTDDLDTLKNIEQKLKEHRKIGVVVQTTQTLSALNPIVEYLVSVSKELSIANTICPSTTKRQTEVRELAKNNDLVIVVGSKNSANTTHLADIAREYTKTIHIENSDELSQYADLIKKSMKIGVTAGASTPQNIIDDVTDKLNIL
ncbi:4-hydroxy-3-methylbut-2-enyl diphosphate reductase [bacterium]|nr:4-hydroxy-3-methylbut-2-enyl diphosphate reductase [bacterium]